MPQRVLCLCVLQGQQEELKLLSADLERRKANLQQAQEDLGRAMEQYEDEVRHQCCFVFFCGDRKGFHPCRLAPCMHVVLYPLCSHISRSCRGPNQLHTHQRRRIP